MELVDLDKQMSAFGNKIEHSVVFQRILGVILFLLITAVWYTLTTIQSSKIYEYYYWGLFFIQYLITMTMKTQFCVFNIILKYRFLALDTKLKEIIDSTRDVTGKQSKLILVQSAEQPQMRLSSVADKIITLSEFHSKLYNISKRINLFYSIQILLITGKYFVEITATLYYNLQKFYKTDVQADDDWYAFSYFIWALMNCADLFILVYTSDSMCSTANGCKMTLHKVNLNSKDMEMKKEVTAFSLQLLHNDLVLTAAGFFNIDFTLIFNIIGAVTTYLVIFVQFDINDPQKLSQDLNSTTAIAILLSEQFTEMASSAISVVNSSLID
ncbi:Gustatory receptor 2a [Carabus blaptoides fortunei]